MYLAPMNGWAASRLRLVRLTRALGVGLMVAAFAVPPARAEPSAPRPAVVTGPKRANFKQEVASAESRYVADWIVDSADNRRLPFLIVDKRQAKVFVFDPQGQLIGAAAALLGLAVGDSSVPGIGERALSTIRPWERTTPAGRFVATLDRNLDGEEILWVDYDSGVALHRVRTSQPKERRAQRLATATASDKRITFGCINVPFAFYDAVVRPAFTGTDGIVYVLPETRSARVEFGAYDVEQRIQPQVATGGVVEPVAAAFP